MDFNPEFYIYNVDFAAASLVAGANLTGSINIDSSADFMLQKLTYFADIAGAALTDSTRVIPLVSLTVTDTGSGRELMLNNIPIPSIFGTGQIPFILPRPKKFRRNSTIQVEVSNFSAATAYNLKLAFIGEKLY